MKLIDKEKVIEEIERIKKEECPTDSYEGRCKMLWFEQFLTFLDTLVTRNEAGVLVNLSQLNRVAKPRVVKSKDEKTIKSLKPSDKVEPKFKVGDWISGYYTTYKVLSVNNDGYLVEDVNENKINILFENEKFHHLWTIQDAEDGDVLAAHECYVIFKEIDGLNIKCYCTYHYMNNPSLYIDTLQNKDAFHPATKEQCELLFRKMEEDGYIWNATTKELSQLSVTKISDKVWSEEDESKIIDSIYEAINVYYLNYPLVLSQIKDWLKIKQRLH